MRAISEAVGPLACRRAAGPAGGFRRSSLSDDRAPHPRSRVPPAQPRSHCPPPGRPHPPIHRHSSGGSDPTPPPPRPRPPAQRSDLRSALRHPDDEPRSSPPQRLRRSSRDPMPPLLRPTPPGAALRSAFRPPPPRRAASVLAIPPTQAKPPGTDAPHCSGRRLGAAPLVHVPPLRHAGRRASILATHPLRRTRTRCLRCSGRRRRGPIGPCAATPAHEPRSFAIHPLRRRLPGPDAPCSGRRLGAAPWSVCRHSATRHTSLGLHPLRRRLPGPDPRYSGRGLGAVRLVSRVSSRSKSAGSSNPL